MERTTREKEKSLLLSFSMQKNCFGNSDLFQSTFAFTWKREKNRQDSRERVCKGERGGEEREREGETVSFGQKWKQLKRILLSESA